MPDEDQSDGAGGEEVPWGGGGAGSGSQYRPHLQPKVLEQAYIALYCPLVTWNPSSYRKCY